MKVLRGFSLMVAGSLLATVGVIFPGIAQAATHSNANEISALKQKYEAAGMSSQNASYFAQLQTQANTMNANHQSIPNLKGVTPLSPNWIATHQAEFHQEVLAHNPAALKAAIVGEVNLDKSGIQALHSLIQRDQQEGIAKNSYTVVLPDGSSISASESTAAVPQSTVTTSTLDPGPWNQSTLFAQHDPGPGSWVTSTTVVYSGDADWSEVKNQVWWNSANNTTNMTYTDGSYSNSGIFQITGHNSVIESPYSSAYGSSEWAQAYTVSDWTATASFNIGFNGLGVSGNVYYQWEQYSICTVNGIGQVHGWVGQT